MTYKIKCRAKVSDECLDGAPTKVQYGEDLPLTADGTYENETIVCDSCYLLLMPFSKSGSALHEELDDAIEAVDIAKGYVRGHPNPQELVDEAMEAARNVRVGTARHSSALASAEIAKAEVDRRQAARPGTEKNPPGDEVDQEELYDHRRGSKFTLEDCQAAVGKRASITLTGVIVEAADANGPFVRFKLDERWGMGVYRLGIDLDALDVEN